VFSDPQVLRAPAPTATQPSNAPRAPAAQTDPDLPPMTLTDMVAFGPGGAPSLALGQPLAPPRAASSAPTTSPFAPAPAAPTTTPQSPFGAMPAQPAPPGAAPSGAGGWALLGANAMMPPDEEEERAADELRNAGRPPSPSTSGVMTPPRGLSPKAPAPAQAPPPAELTLEEESPAPDPSARSIASKSNPSIHSNASGVLGASTSSPGTSGVREAPGRPAQAPPPNIGVAGGGAPPVAPLELESIPLATDPTKVTPPPASVDSERSSGDLCKRCGARVLSSMIRCPNCFEPLPTGRRAAPRIPSAQAQARRVGRIVIALVATAVVLGGAAVTVFLLSGARNDGAPTPEEAVTGFFNSVFDGQLRSSLKFLHPSHQKIAEDSVAAHERSGASPQQMVASVVRTSGVGRIGLRVEKTVALDQTRARVEVLLERDGLPMRRTALPTRREKERWFVEANPFGGIP
jgi:hypothetical protein